MTVNCWQRSLVIVVEMEKLERHGSMNGNSECCMATAKSVQ